MAFYESFFQSQYPFAKMDSIFMPDFAWGAMEFPAAVTYNESLVPMRENNVLEVSRRGHVFLHELSHMWFGNLVTMQWWNNLWLNESFAEFVCHKAFDAIYRELSFKTVIPWVSFQCSKCRGYKEDQLPSTHPIAGEVVDTQVACSIFDGITYQKGSSVLKQLMCIIGVDTFSKSCQKYFEKYAWSNTTLEDLLAEFDLQLKSQGSDIDVFEWKEDWINKAGLNWIKYEANQAEQKPYLHQGACLEAYPTLRTHFLNVAYFDDEAQVIHVDSVKTERGERTYLKACQLEVVGVLPNYEVRHYLPRTRASSWSSSMTSLLSSSLPPTRRSQTP